MKTKQTKKQVAQKKENLFVLFTSFSGGDMDWSGDLTWKGVVVFVMPRLGNEISIESHGNGNGC